jgi:hypothetical protein
MRTIERADDRGRTVAHGRRRRWSTRTRLLVGLGAVLVACWLAFAAVQLVRARHEALTGINRLETLRANLSVGSVSSGSDLDDLQRANTHFRAANHHARSPALMPLRVLPVVGRQIRSVDALSEAASEVTTIAEARLSQARQLLARGRIAAPQRVAFVDDIGQLGRDAGADLADVHLGPSAGLVGPLAHARDRFTDELASLRRSADHIDQAATGVASLLQGPRNYLLLASNNSEMRMGSGAFLSAGVLAAADGSFHLSPMQSITEYTLPDDRVPLRGDLLARWGWLAPNREWRNLASSPRFDANAELAAQMWKASTGQDVDGVMALDIVALRGLLEVTGPVEVDGVTISAKNVLDDVMLRQYLRAAAAHTEDERREDLSLVASAVVDRLQNGSWDGERLASELVDIAAGRHLLLWSARAEEQKGWAAVAVAGTLGPDSVMLGVHNRGGNKLDQFLDIRADLTTRIAANGTEVEVHVRMRNTTPIGLPQKVAGPFPDAVDGAEGRYQGLLTLQIPPSARNARVEGDDHPVATGPDGNSQVIAAYVQLDRGASLDRTITFLMPRAVHALRIEPSARVPAVEWWRAGSQWFDKKPQTVTWE